ncbi:MAG TPA: ATP-binding protein, partial [Blastocatellia bacterium]
LTRRPVDINQIVTSATQLLEPQIASGKIDVRLDLIESGATALIDEPSMRSVVMNLMLNSIQAMKDGGKLTVTTTRSEEGINLEVADTGEGMTAEQTKNLFEPFYTTKSQGLGLGMFHAWKVIKLHGGTILIETQVGKGTRIKVTLPAEEKDETSSPHS